MNYTLCSVVSVEKKIMMFILMVAGSLRKHSFQEIQDIQRTRWLDFEINGWINNIWQMLGFQSNFTYYKEFLCGNNDHNAIKHSIYAIARKDQHNHI